MRVGSEVGFCSSVLEVWSSRQRGGPEGGSRGGSRRGVQRGVRASRVLQTRALITDTQHPGSAAALPACALQIRRSFPPRTRFHFRCRLPVLGQLPEGTVQQTKSRVSFNPEINKKDSLFNVWILTFVSFSQ